jgi:hypothetical protein
MYRLRLRLVSHHPCPYIPLLSHLAIYSSLVSFLADNNVMALWFTLVRLLIVRSGGFLLAFAQTTPSTPFIQASSRTITVGVAGNRPLTLLSIWQNPDSLILTIQRAMYMSDHRSRT